MTVQVSPASRRGYRSVLSGRLRFGLLGGAALRLDREVCHRRAVRSTVPVVLASRDQDDVTSVDDLLLVVRRDDGGPFGDDEDLIARVLVELVARASTEAHDAEVHAVHLVR